MSDNLSSGKTIKLELEKANDGEMELELVLRIPKSELNEILKKYQEKMPEDMRHLLDPLEVAVNEIKGVIKTAFPKCKLRYTGGVY